MTDIRTTKPLSGSLEDSLPWPRWEIWALAAITLAGFALRVARISSRGLWMDEVHSYDDALLIFNAGFYHKTHFLYFMLLRGALCLGKSEFALRLPSLLFSAGAVPLAHVALRRWFRDRAVATLGSALMALSLYQIVFAQEARYYSGITFFAFLSMILLLRLMTRPGAVVFLLFGLVHIASYAIHPVTGVLFCAQMLTWAGYALATGQARGAARSFAALKARPARVALGAAALAATFALLGAVAWYLFPIYWKMLCAGLSNLPARGAAIAESANAHSAVSLVKFLTSPMYSFGLRGLGEASWPSLQAGKAYVLLAGLGFLVGAPRWRWQSAFMAIAYVGSFLALWVLFEDPIFRVKYFTYLFPVFVFCVVNGALAAGGLAARAFRLKTPEKARAAIAGVMLLGLQIAQAPDYLAFYTTENQPVRPALEFIRSRQPDGGVLVSNSLFYGKVFNYYKEQYGFEGEEYWTLPLSDPRLRKLIEGDETVWLCVSFERASGKPSPDGSAKDHAALLSQFEKVAEFPSFWDPSFNLTVYRHAGADQ